MGIVLCVSICNRPILRRKRVNVSPLVGSGLLQTPSARQGTAAEGAGTENDHANEGSQSPTMDAKIQVALSHPKRTEIFGHLRKNGNGTSEAELAQEFGMGIRLVEYHLKVLHDADLIVCLDGEQGPGRAGRSYVAASNR